MAQIVFKTIVRKLAADRIAGASHAGAIRIAALNHKAGNDTVKNGAVVKTLFDERDKIVDRIRGNLRVQLNLNFAVICFNGDNRIPGIVAKSSGMIADALIAELEKTEK